MPTLADICRASGDAYLERHPKALPSHRRALSDIATCRTEIRGGQVYRCTECGRIETTHHSCRNRHCPRCQTDRTASWVDRLDERSLPVDHFFITFTLPAELRPLAYANQKAVYGAMMREASRTVIEVLERPRTLGATPGIVAVLHTWRRDLGYHPHVHLLVTGGGLTRVDGEPVWRFPRNRHFLVSGRILQTVFRKKMRDALCDLVSPNAPVWSRDWNLKVKNVGDGRNVVRYLGQYVHRVGLTDDRIAAFDRDDVTFKWFPSGSRRPRRMTLPVDAFLGRFLQHVLPRGFVKVRHSGLMAPTRRKDLEAARRLILNASRMAPPDSDADEPEEEKPPRHCPACETGVLEVVARFRPGRAPPLIARTAA